LENKKIWLSSPHMSGEELTFVTEAIDSNWVAPLGPQVDAFERELADLCGTKGAAVLSSGTAAIHLALLTLGIGEGDFVICQSFTFSATANPIRYVGAKPIFVDSESNSWNMDPDLLEKAILACPEPPKAIIPVHLYGMPANIERIRLICEVYGIPMIEDAAESLGSVVNGKACGSFGHFGVLSFNGNKIITTSGGGALVSDDLEALEHVRFLSTQARDKAPHYQHSHIGYNYRMSNVLAAIGRAQLRVLSDRVEARRAHFEAYKKELSQFAGITFQPEPNGVRANRWLTAILVDPEQTGGVTREDIRQSLEAQNIESRPLWKPMHQQPIFSKYISHINGTSDRYFEHGLCLPSGSNMSAEDRSRVIEIIKKVLCY